MRPSVMSCCLAFVAGAIVYVAACGGRIILPGCSDTHQHFCTLSGVCCQDGWTCGEGINGCPLRACCPGGSAGTSANVPSGEQEYDAGYGGDPIEGHNSGTTVIAPTSPQ